MRITGRIQHENGEPAPLVHVYFSDKNGKVTDQVNISESDDNGIFAIENATNAQYITIQNYQEKQTKPVFESGVNFILKNIQLEGVTITAKREIKNTLLYAGLAASTLSFFFFFKYFKS